MPHTLLLADDSVTIQRVIELTFADEDIRVVAVSDGAQAVREAQASPPDIVLADVGMPEMDGYDVAAFIKRTPGLSHIPVLLLTGAFEPIDEDRARSVGCDGVLVKPFEPQMVISRVKDLIAGRPVAGTVQPRGEGPLPVPPQAPVAPPPPATDEYFDRLDAALASFDSTAQMSVAAPETSEVQAPAASEARAPVTPAERVPTADGAEAATLITPAPLPEPFLSKPGDAFAGQTETTEEAATSGSVPAPSGSAPTVPVPTPSAPAAAPAPSVPTPSASAPAPSPPMGAPSASVSAPVGSAPEPATPVLADAFEALLAAEQGRPLESAVAQKLAAGDTLIDHITRQVIERLADDRMRDLVLEVAERLVREEIDRIKSAAGS